MSNKPYPLSEDEIREIAELKILREMWGADNREEMEELLRTSIFAARFDYRPSMRPGHVGDMFILVGDAPAEPLTLIRESKSSILRIL